MRNLAEQKKLYSPLIALLFTTILFVAIFLVFYYNAMDITQSLFGIRFYDFDEELVKVDDYDVAEGDSMFYIEQGSKVIIREVGFEELEENDIIFFYYNDEGENVVVAQIYKGRDEGIDGETVYYVHALDDAAVHTVNIASGHLLGVYSSHIQYLGTVSAYLTESAALMYGSLVLLGLLLFVVPIAVFVIRLKKRRMGSPFPEGVNINKLNTENLYIYENMRRFFAEAGVFTIEKGYDCDLIYIGKRLFAVLHCTNGNMYVNINKNFQRYDGKVDRAGYICIPHASSIPTAQKRVNSIYQAYFSNFKYMQARKRRRPRPNTATGLPRQNPANRLPR